MGKNILEKLKAWGFEIWYFISSRIFWVNFGKMAGITAVFAFMIFGLLKCFTRHGDTVQVGNYVNKSMTEVKKMLDEGDFEFVIIDSVYRPNAPADIVLSQDPLPGAIVKPGRNIYLTITKAKGDLSPLPDIAGRDNINSYRLALENFGFVVGKIDTVLDAQYADGTVMQVVVGGTNIIDRLRNGYRVPQGMVIDLVISKKDNPTESIVPSDLVGKTGEEAINILSILGYQVEVIKDPSVTNQNSAFVTEIDPPAGSTLDKGSVVRITLSQKKNIGGQSNPDFDQ